MKKTSFVVFVLLLYMSLTTCENNILKEWWRSTDDGLSELYVNDIFQMESGFTEILQWIRENIQDNTYYTVQTGADYTISPEAGRFHYENKVGITICITGKYGIRTINLSGNKKGALFDVGSEVKLILKKNIILRGHNNNNAALVMVSEGGSLVMEDGTEITGNYNHYNKTPWAAGGEREPETTNGGGVCVIKGNFIMNGGEIYNNKTDLNGAGIILFESTGIMNNGKIYNNEAVYDGGGINVSSSKFTMSGGIIYGNKAGWGGGVRIAINSSLYYFRKEPVAGGINSGIIYGSDAKADLANKASTYGDAIAQYGTFAAKRTKTLDETTQISTDNRSAGWD